MLQPLHQPHFGGFNANPTLLRWARDTTIEVHYEPPSDSISRLKPKGRLVSRDLPPLAIHGERDAREHAP